MKINEIIRAKRREQGMTQEQAVQAVALGTPIVFRGGCAPLGERHPPCINGRRGAPTRILRYCPRWRGCSEWI